MYPDQLSEFLTESYKRNFKKALTLKEVAYIVLKEGILTGALGKEVTENQISDILGISRTPVREAMHQLESDGLLEISHGKKAQIRVLTPKDNVDIARILNCLHSLSTELCIENATDEDLHSMEETIALIAFYTKRKDYSQLTRYNAKFHLQIAIASKNPWLADILEKLLSYTTIYRQFALSRPNRIDAACQEHEEIFNAICARDNVTAQKVLKRHIDSAFHIE